jgi:hypothetical protein
MDHYRETCPGRKHAECVPGDKSCRVHVDKVNPHCSLPDAAEHFLDSDLGFAITIGGLMLGLLGVAHFLGRPQSPYPTRIFELTRPEFS